MAKRYRRWGFRSWRRRTRVVYMRARRSYRRRRASKKNNTLLYVLGIGVLGAGGYFVYNKFIKK